MSTINQVKDFDGFSFKQEHTTPLETHPREWASRVVTAMNSWDKELDRVLPNLELQTSLDQFADEIKKMFAPLDSVNKWLEENGHGDWQEKLAHSLIRLPVRSARNVLMGLYGIMSNIVYTAAHPLKGINHLAKEAVLLLDGFTKPENWSKSGLASMGASFGQSLVFANPLSTLGMGIGAALLAAGVSVDAFDAAIRAESGKEIEAIQANLLGQVQVAPEYLLTGLFTGLLLGGIRRMRADGEMKIQPIEEKPTPRVEFEKIPGVAQYKNSDWSGHIVTKGNMTLEEAMKFAESKPDVDYFFHMKGWMHLESAPPQHRYFRPGDAVFFSGEPWWGSAPGYSDGYVKK